MYSHFPKYARSTERIRASWPGFALKSFFTHSSPRVRSGTSTLIAFFRMKTQPFSFSNSWSTSFGGGAPDGLGPRTLSSVLGSGAVSAAVDEGRSPITTRG